MRRAFTLSLFLCAALAAVSTISAQESTIDASWMWIKGGDPAADAPKGKVWFRRQVRSNDPSTGMVRIAADDSFTLWVNGKKIGEGKGDTSYTFNLNAIVDRGPNVIAVEAENTSGRAGLFIEGEVRAQTGQSIPFDSGPEWVATREKPEGDAWLQPDFDTSEWDAVHVIGKHEESPWKHIVFSQSYLDRYALAEGFQIERIAEPDLAGSLISMTWGNRGRLIVARERGPIFSLVDENGDGVYDKAIEFSNAVPNCQGLCMVGNDLYVVGQGKGGAGLYRMTDADGDDKADSVELLLQYKGNMGEHGPHTVVFGPDGWLYNNLGNHAWVTAEPEPTTPVRNQIEGNLLEPKFEDGNGHAAGIKVPGGTIWRFTPDGKKWWLETAGFRNEYDFGFNAAGDCFSFDSDMEWDVGMPWYRPVRINHCIPGADFGWRSGAAKWPVYYYDSLPSTADIGRGSPTGVVFYDHEQFPEDYRGAFLACDWSLGRIVAVRIKPDGASFASRWDVLASGNPLNVSDIEIDRDGSVVFTTGGRNTEGGVYRIRYTGAKAKPAKAENIDELLSLPQIQANWAREIAAKVKESYGDRWAEVLADVAQNGKPNEKIRALTLLSQLGPKPQQSLLIELTRDDAPEVRSFALWLLGSHSGDDVAEALTVALDDDNAMVRRRACEAFVRSGIEAPVDPLVKMLASDDRWLQWAARLALERVPVKKWQSKVLESDDSRVVLLGLLAMSQLGDDSPLDVADGAHRAVQILANTKEPLQTRLNALRFLQRMHLANSAAISAEDRKLAIETLKPLLAKAPTRPADQSLETAFQLEAARTLAVLPGANVVEPLVNLLETTDSEAMQIHFALCLRYAKDGWTLDAKERYLNWYDTTKGWEGGHSMHPYLANIVGDSLEYFSPQDRKQLLANWQKRPLSTQLILRRSGPAEIADFEAVAQKIIKDLEDAPPRDGAEQLTNIAVEALTKVGSESAQAALRKLYDDLPDRRDFLIRSIAKFPTEANRPYLLRSVRTGDETAMQFALRGLANLKTDEPNADDVRAVILAGLRLNDRGGATAVNVLRKWTKSKADDPKDVRASLAHYQQWYSEQFPDAPPAELPTEDPNRSKFSVDELIAFLDSAEGSKGDPSRGRELFHKVNCVKCHKLGALGEGVGPDLSGLRKRFQRKEIVESILLPSQVISDQYKSVTVMTTDGLVHTGMEVQIQDRTKTVLLLSDATRLEIPNSEIDEKVAATVSVMPEGLVKDFELKDFADLFAFLETTKLDEVAAAKN